VVHVDDLIKPRAEQILLAGLPSLAWSHRKSPAPSARARGITACDSRESLNRICKEIALQRPEAGKFDYLSAPNHPAHSTASEFFTDDYVDSVRVGNLLFLAGNTAAPDWKFKGKVGKDLTVQEGYDTARQVGLIMLAKVRAALGSLDRVKRVVKVLGMVNSADGFGDQPRVINGFSDLMVEVFGEAIGKHARSAVGMAGLPFNNAVEVEMIVEVE